MPRPVLNLTVGALQYTGMVYSANVVQQEYGIDVATISVPMSQVSQAAYTKDTPILLTWGRTPALLTTFPGYIHHVEPERTQNSALARIVCTGAVAPSVRDAAIRVWPAGSNSQTAAVAIADALHLSSMTEATPVQAPGGPVRESWWNYLVRMSKQCGFTCYAVGTDLRFHSRRAEGKGIVPWFQHNDQVRMQFANNLLSYRLVMSDDLTTDALRRKRRAFGVTDEGLPVRLTDNGDLESTAGLQQNLPTLTRNENFVVHDYGSAATRLAAEQNRHRFSMQSEFVVSGDETVRQGSTVILRGMRPDMDGYWYVTKAEHLLTTASYSIRLSAGRDGTGDSAPIDLTASVPVVDLGRGEPTPTPRPVLRTASSTVNDLIFAPTSQSWIASATQHRDHFPWRAAVRG